MEALDDPLGNMGDIIENAKTVAGIDEEDEEETKDGITAGADESMKAAA